MPATPLAAPQESGRAREVPGLYAFVRVQTQDDVLASLLICAWTVTSGRVLRSDVPPAQLSEEELIAFWADDHVALSGAAVRRPRLTSGRG